MNSGRVGTESIESPVELARPEAGEARAGSSFSSNDENDGGRVGEW